MGKSPIVVPDDRARWQQLCALLALISGTGRLVDGHPESVMVIGGPAGGKSTMLLRMRLSEDDFSNSHLHFITSGTSYGVLNILTDKVPRGTTHLVAPEMQTLMMRKGALWDSFHGLMLPAMEEGVDMIEDGGRRRPLVGRPKLGLMAAMTTRAFYGAKDSMEDSGLLSRMLVVSWERDAANVLRARHAYTYGDHSELRKVICGWPRKISVGISRRTSSIIDRYAADVDAESVHRGSRRFSNIARVFAAVRGDKEATERHFEAIRSCEWAWRIWR